MSCHSFSACCKSFVMSHFLDDGATCYLFAVENNFRQRKMANENKQDNSFDDSNEKLKKIIDDKKNESSAFRKILKSLDKNVKRKNSKND